MHAPMKNPLLKRLLWFAALWLAGVITLSVVAMAIKFSIGI